MMRLGSNPGGFEEREAERRKCRELQRLRPLRHPTAPSNPERETTRLAPCAASGDERRHASDRRRQRRPSRKADGMDRLRQSHGPDSRHHDVASDGGGENWAIVTSLGEACMSGRIWTPPDCNSRLDWDRWSQLLTYIRLRDAAGQLLRREPRWVFARFHLNGPETSAEAVPVHTSGSGSDGVTVSPSPAICCNCRGGTLLSLFAASLHAAFTDSAGS